MPSEIEKFQRDLLESVQQMKRGEAARTLPWLAAGEEQAVSWLIAHLQGVRHLTAPAAAAP